MKKVLLIIVLTISILIGNTVFQKFLGFSNVKIAVAMEKEKSNEQPNIYYDTFFEDLNPKQLLAVNNSIYATTDNKIYNYDKEDGRWRKLEIIASVNFVMGTLKALDYCELKDGFIIKNYSKIVIDINNDGKEIYELEELKDKTFQWLKIIENGRFCKALTPGADEFKIINFYNESVEENNIKIDNTKFYFEGNILYGQVNGKEKEFIKDYGDIGNKALRIMKFGKESFVFGGNFGVERIIKKEDYKGYIYSTCSVGEFNSLSEDFIVDMASGDNGHTLFALSNKNKIYKVIMANTWVPWNNEIEEINFIQCNSKEEKINEITVENKIFKIVKNEQYQKSFITINDKIIHQTIRDSYQYPDEILTFNGKDEYIYFWSDVSQPIRINIKEETVEFMGQSFMFEDTVNNGERLVKTSDGTLYLVKNQDEIYRYIEKNNFYDSGLSVKASDIKFFNGSCYAITDDGLYRFNSIGEWEVIIKGDINDNYEEKLIVLGNNLYALSEGVLSKLNEENKWEIIGNKINKGLTPNYFINEREKKIYFVSEEMEKKYVTIIDYSQKQWSKTKALPEIANINSLAVEGNNIYVGTQYVSNGLAYVYKNGTWNNILPQLNIKVTGTMKNSKLIKQNDYIYFQTSENGKDGFGIWKVKNGEVSKVENNEEKEKIIKLINEKKDFEITEIGIVYALRNGKVLRKII